MNYCKSGLRHTNGSDQMYCEFHHHMGDMSRCFPRQARKMIDTDHPQRIFREMINKEEKALGILVNKGGFPRKEITTDMDMDIMVSGRARSAPGSARSITSSSAGSAHHRNKGVQVLEVMGTGRSYRPQLARYDPQYVTKLHTKPWGKSSDFIGSFYYMNPKAARKAVRMT